MDEASSIFLDNFAVEKLLEHKLGRVSHKPSENIERNLFNEVNDVTENRVTEKDGKIFVESLTKTGFVENDNFFVDTYIADEEKGKIIFVHGLFEDNKDMYSFLFKMLNQKGFSIYFCTLPYHYDRTPKSSSFSGEFFWSGDINRTLLAFKQATLDVYSLYKYIKSEYGEYPHLCGFSIGGAVLAKLLSLVDISSNTFLLNPLTNVLYQVWSSDLWSTIKKDLINNNFTYEKINDAYKEVCPSEIKNFKTDLKRVTCVNGLYDKLVEIDKVEDFFQKWQEINRHIYKCGHLNMLRVPKLSEDINRFFRSEVKNEELLSTPV